MWIPKNEIDHWMPIGNGEAVPVRKGQSDEDAKKAFIDEKDAKKASQQQGKDRKSQASKDNTSTIKEQVKANKDKIAKTKVVAIIPRGNMTTDYQTAATTLKTKLSANGGIVKRKGLGDVQVGLVLKNARRYVHSPIEISALAAVPSVIRNGIEIATHIDHKGRNYSTYTIAGRVSIAGKDCVVAVVIAKTNDNRYKVHRVLTPDGQDITIKKDTDG